MPSSFDLILKNGKCFIDGQLKAIDIGISNGIIKSIGKIEKTNNEKILDVNEMSKILTSTEFIPCPNGFVHPETYRLYEALECGCIPIVENAYKYYDRLFPNNPFIKVDMWIEAKPVVREWNDDQIKQKREECRTWWSQYKKQLQEFTANKINL